MQAKHKTDKTKTNTSFLWKYEQKWIAWAVPKVPKFLNGRNLTWATSLWSAIIITCGYLSKQNIYWVWGISASIVGQYITDSLDGAVGRYRESGLVNWGHYVDHLLDFVFLCAVIISYAFIFPEHLLLLMILLAIFGSHYASTFLIFSFSKKFHMAASGIGMNELKILLLVFNAIIFFNGTGFVETMLIILSLLALLALFGVIHTGQKEADKIDNLRRNRRTFCS